jgi:uncharacterized protein YjbJ (UPF0337 family)
MCVLQACGLVRAAAKHAAIGSSASMAGHQQIGNNIMNNDRIIGSAKQIHGAVKEAAGKVLGDAKLTVEGKAEKAEGKVQNEAGSIKDAVKDVLTK